MDCVSIIVSLTAAAPNLWVVTWSRLMQYQDPGHQEILIIFLFYSF